MIMRFLGENNLISLSLKNVYNNIIYIMLWIYQFVRLGVNLMPKA